MTRRSAFLASLVLAGCGLLGEPRDCGNCQGSGRIRCGRCDGDGKTSCRVCLGTKVKCCDACEGRPGNKAVCETCRPRAVKADCPTCKGTGAYRCAAGCSACAAGGSHFCGACYASRTSPCACCCTGSLLGRIPLEHKGGPCGPCKAEGQVVCAGCQGAARLVCRACDGKGKFKGGGGSSRRSRDWD